MSPDLDLITEEGIISLPYPVEWDDNPGDRVFCFVTESEDDDA